MNAVLNVAAKIDGQSLHKVFSGSGRRNACEGITCAEV